MRELWSLIEAIVGGHGGGDAAGAAPGQRALLRSAAPQLLTRLGVTFEQLVYPQLAAGERSVSAQQAFDLAALATTARRESAINGTRFRKEFQTFIDKYGHRGRYESDWSLPRYSEDTAPILAAIAAHGQDTAPGYPAAIKSRQDREARGGWTASSNVAGRAPRWTLPRVAEVGSASSSATTSGASRSGRT